jgi:hypothetical protein
MPMLDALTRWLKCAKLTSLIFIIFIVVAILLHVEYFCSIEEQRPVIRFCAQNVWKLVKFTEEWHYVTAVIVCGRENFEMSGKICC